MSNFDKAVSRMRALASHFDDQACDGKKNCDLKFYHTARASLKAYSSIQDIFVHDKYPVRAAGLMSRTRASQRLEETGDDSDSGEEHVIESLAPADNVILNKCDQKLQFFCSELVEDLSKNVVDEWERELIEKTCDIVDISKMVREMKDMKMSPDIYSESSFPRYKEAVDFLKIPGLDFIEDSVLKGQYKKFIQIITSLSVSSSGEEHVIDSKQVIMKLFSSVKLYEDIQIVNHTISVAATKSTTESVLESFVSEYEYTSNSRANYSETGLCDTFEIQKDGPLVTKCDNLVKTVLDKYFSDRQTNGWHFVMKKTENLMKTSKTLAKVDEKQSKLPFME